MFDNSNEGHHYAWIKNLDRRLRSSGDHQKKFCPFCLHGFRVEGYTPEKMKEHMDTCSHMVEQR